MLILSFFLLNGALFVGSEPEAGSGTPENITVQLIDSKTVEVFWSTTWKNVERYDVTYNPAENRVVSQAAGNSQSIILRELRPDTQYQVTVTAVVGGKNYRSRRLVFRTSSAPDDALDWREIQQPAPTKPTKQKKAYPVTPEVINPDPTAIGSKYTPPTSTTVRGVEIGLVLLALVVWIIAIALFFHRWGKIRMLLPYQPDYKTQQSLKVPGTGTTIVSGCTGSSATQGQTEGPGCVQHLRWSSRTFEEPSTVKKCSPSRWALRPRVSSAVFPTAHSYFYSRTSAECESPRIIRHAHSHSEFPAEVIPLCQVNQPPSESPHRVISMTVPAIASSVNEKTNEKKSEREAKAKESEGNSCHDDNITKFEESDFYKKDNEEKMFSDRNKDLGAYRPRDQENRHVATSLFFVESAGTRFPETSEPDKPRRYNRSSLKKQKVRLCDDRDSEPIKIVPIIEHQENIQKAHEPENRKSKNLKTAEMKRKAFLRKVSLQDTYLNYNQDYWLDFKKSGRFHNSIDLGYFGNENPTNGRTDAKQRTGEVRDQEEAGPLFLDKSNQTEPSTTTRQLKLPLTPGPRPRRSGSDPVLFRDSSSGDCGLQASSEALAEAVIKCNSGGQRSSWFFLPSDENIPLFSERNGLIETDFHVLGDLADEYIPRRGGSGSSTEEAKEWGLPPDLSHFYEIQLRSEAEDGEGGRGRTFDFRGGDAFFGRTLTSFSGDSEVSYEAEVLTIPENWIPEISHFVQTSSSPPKSTPHYY